MLKPIDVRYFKMAVGTDRIKHESQSDISARCPICGDSKHSRNKARLHLYERNGVTLVNCFNECSCVNKPVYKFLKDYYPNLLSSYRRETFNSKIDILKTENNDNLDDLVGDLDFDVPKISEEYQFEKPKILFDISNRFEKSNAYDYIESRGLEWSPSLGDIYVSRKPLTIDGKFYNIKDFIIIPLYCGDKWYGFYSRSLTEHKFYTYIPEKNTGFKIWNLYNIDKSKPIYVFEGIFDALTAYNNGIINVVACMGAKLPLEMFKDCDLIFALDNDTTGLKNSLMYAKRGYKVVIYNNNIKDLNEMYQKDINIKDVLNNISSGINAVIKIQGKL